ncbi:MAG: hypothetical protein LQ342_000806 [Letrouitia transgressa]|nr:MAG: hypothetical protein LQ342_000806 [Letrouitia transgressa]
MRSKVILITGGTSGIGAVLAHDLAQRGAQIILLTQQAPSDPFLVDFIEDLRRSTNNELIYAEQVNLASLHSIRLFATKWVDNAPPRRLDMIILCANTLKPRYGVAEQTEDDIESTWGVNYLSNFHLLSILSPAIRAQPPDRDVRIIFGTCSSYIGGDMGILKENRSHFPRAYETSKLALMIFAWAFQKHIDSYQRPDKQQNNARVILVDPGYTRTPGMRRWLTMGSLWGLLIYLVLWPIWWLVLKSPIAGAQSFLFAAMESQLGRGPGGCLVKECRERDFLKNEVKDGDIAKNLWGYSEKQIKHLEKSGAIRRAAEKKASSKTHPERSTEAEKNSGVPPSDGSTVSQRKSK